MAFGDAITDLSMLRDRYGEARQQTLAKIIDHIDDGARDYIAKSPFVVLATSSPTGTDASPRGGPPGFVTVLDEHRIALGDLAGNRILDSFSNVLDSPSVGLLFLIPGMDETLRVNGRATLTTEPAVLDACAIDGRVPKVALGVDVEQCYVHCAKAFRRSQLWSPDSWLDPHERPSAACMIRDHNRLDVEPEVIEANLEAGYVATMWETGG
jgi:uncharacterized protein